MGCFDWFRFTAGTTPSPRIHTTHVKSLSLTSLSASSVMVPTGQDVDDAPSTCFTCTRLNPSTFRIVEADKYGEFPFIYAKVYDSVIVLIDTGCGGAARDPGVRLTSLRDFIETYPVQENDRKPINSGGRKSYIVICTHCHYDHIGGIAQFTDVPKSAIWASGYDKGFIEDDLPTSSLCRFVGMETPKYTVTKWAANAEPVLFGDNDLGLTVYQTPGHTPDELSIWDQKERVLFVGDTLYERAPILFSLSGNLDDYAATLHKLRELVDGWNRGVAKDDHVTMACGHCTQDTPAAEFIYEVESFFDKIRRGLVSPIDKGTTPGRNIPLVGFEREDGWFSVVGPKELFDKFRVGNDP
ncbi:hypothetical protein FJTKL_03829 [Diaporthe vaccinii]|uniref:Metallo-beta-lactamase domain-containing protein n=1 Tax=Diaporthe vaccinii TaxID=105482 RepID=A0ABR4F198_9PEZI